LPEDLKLRLGGHALISDVQPPWSWPAGSEVYIVRASGAADTAHDPAPDGEASGLAKPGAPDLFAFHRGKCSALAPRTTE
jgi:hypothetical protein